MCNGIAVVVVKNDNEIDVFCDPDNGSHDKLLSKYVPIEKHSDYIKVEYIYPGEFRLDCPDTECRIEALKTELVEKVGINDTLRLKPSTVAKLAGKMPLINNWPKKLMQQAYLSGANLSKADLSEADLSGANLLRAYLFRADLSEADLSGANLSGADLSGANLSGANLFKAYLFRADLSEADLSGANLSGAYLFGTYLFRADLSEADLSGANLSGADLSVTYLSGANLSGANLSEEDKKYAKEHGAIIK